MRNDLMQEGRDGNHRALGLEPEAAQRLQMLDRPHRPLRRCRAPEIRASTASPEQGTARSEVVVKPRLVDLNWLSHLNGSISMAEGDLDGGPSNSENRNVRERVDFRRLMNVIEAGS